MRSCTVRVTIFSNGSIIPPGFKFTELHVLTLAAQSRSYALLLHAQQKMVKKLLTCIIYVDLSLYSGISTSQVFAATEKSSPTQTF